MLRVKTKIYTVRMGFRKFLCMVPYMHLWIVEEILQWTEGDLDIGMVEMADGQRKKVNYKEIINPKSDHRKGDILQDAVYNILHPVKPEMGCESHFLNGMVDFMEFPQKGDTVKESMDIPLDKIPDNKKRQ